VVWVFFPVQWVHSGCRVLLIVGGAGVVFLVQWVMCFLLFFNLLSTMGALFC
jgi:hypothetical protein